MRLDEEEKTLRRVSSLNGKFRFLFIPHEKKNDGTIIKVQFGAKFDKSKHVAHIQLQLVNPLI